MKKIVEDYNDALDNIKVLDFISKVMDTLAGWLESLRGENEYVRRLTFPLYMIGQGLLSLLAGLLAVLLSVFAILGFPFYWLYWQVFKKPDIHYHKEPDGLLVKCFHHCKSVVASPGFWIGVTLSFPVEHYLWEKVWPFYLISHWLGL